MVIMGKVIAAYGIKGWIKVRPFTERPDSLLDYETWHLAGEKSWQPCKVVKASVRGNVLVAKLQDVADRTAAEKYKGLLVAVPREQLPPTEEDEYYWSDLIGLTVENLAGSKLGVVESLLETGANDVLVVKGKQGEVLIPFISSVIQQVSLQDKIIRVDWQADYLK